MAAINIQIFGVKRSNLNLVFSLENVLIHTSIAKEYAHCSYVCRHNINILLCIYIDICTLKCMTAQPW